MEDKKAKDKSISDILQFVAPGAPIRDGIDNVLRANTGGLIVVGYNDKVKSVLDGGFHINCPFSPSYLYELAKMDGAIVLNESGTKIILANAQLAPDVYVPSTETGMRHRTAERVARQTNALVIAISQRRNVITLYQGNFRYALKDISVILTKANQAVQTLEKYKVVLDQSISNLSVLEFEELVTQSDLLQVLHRFEMVLRIKNELLTYLSELGTEGRLIRLQMNELLSDIESEAMLIFRDYAMDRNVKAFELLYKFQELVRSEVLEDNVLLKLLGYQGYPHHDEAMFPRGYRVLNKIPRLPIVIIENVINEYDALHHIVKATVEDLDEVEGIGEVRARKIKEGLKLIKEQTFADRQL
ncbi:MULTISPECIES: DNA integrity scanning diadenylate cyclase DisA [Rossellomorea]|jgi:diadenylate cyclase|uniref:DNA integrity scanning protein DisA n=1 Tax=Rossellomorea marisflavi TaxID=189381 RepID=A0A0J5S0K7_9BACI|nr:DNA integrity scanning diadenylate cyclase DisA [Rossellomorea marisflavi]KQU56609.1 DNA integrity scanning protein DisA [Bacillus sp. Leaf406]VXA93145.1 diadenylate cyclase; DNA integrity scanning protein; cell cycle checkpoint DNA scanning protein [Bacillus sp. 349Y]KMK90858.1 DNA integrity scanning protein DisA [Rossellomorea marisflavi]KML02230.1 DNA integrity scanning protein DisA [Rossellomorea marisflavi]KML26954.1 DNA integrity scanning protein DisA [Rossellomorea marisflavi]